MHKFKNSLLPLEERIEDLLSLMTTEEKILQTDQYYSHDFTTRDANEIVTGLDIDVLHAYLNGNSAGSVQIRSMTAAHANEVQRYAVEKTRLGIPFILSEEALHGLLAAKATSFPQQIGLAATFNPSLGKKMGRAIATEARACGIHETYSPVMDLMRDPRFGRTEESYGEDVYLCSEFAREVVLGMQGESLCDSNAIAAEPKHFVGYGNPVGGLNCAPSTMGRHDIFAECLPVFEAAYVEGKAVNAMCSYNAIDGVPVSMDKELLTDVLRGDFGMPGFVRSDMTAIVRLNDWHFITPTRKEAIKEGLQAGVDLQLYDFPHDEWQESIAELLQEGLLNAKVLDEACRRVLRVKFMLGLFENPYIDETLQEKVVNCEKHKLLALQIARQSICLLKNQNNILPLDKSIKKIALLGPSANEAMLGDYSENRGRTNSLTVLDGLKQILPQDTEIVYERGCNFLGDTIIPFNSGMLLDENGNPGLTARYYNGNKPGGIPVVTRTDLMVNFNWIYSVPHPKLDNRCYSVAWTGFVEMPRDVNGCIGLSSQDSMRLYVDDELLVDGWGEDKDSNQQVNFHFKTKKRYNIRIEFTNDQRAARIIFGYNSGRENFEKAVAAATKADIAIVCIGDNEETSGENFDRITLDLPGRQLDFAKAIYATGTPVVLVLQSGRPVSANWEQDNLPAILQAWFPGEQGGLAIAQTLFGDNEPSGRLPISFPRSVGQIPCHYSRKPGGGKRYVEMTWDPLYPFGYGQSYTTFSYSDYSVSGANIVAGESVEVSFKISNTGERSGVSVPQVYIRDCFSSVVKPIKELAAFCRVELAAGECKEITLSVKPRSMRTLDPSFNWHIEPGDFELFVGDNAQNVLWESKFAVL